MAASRTSAADRGEGHSHLYTPDEPISLCLAYSNPMAESEEIKSDEPSSKRYFKCPAALTVHHLKKFISLKFELPPRFMVQMWSGDHYLTDDLTLMDVAYILTWTREEPLSLEYRFIPRPPRLKETRLPPVMEREEEKKEEPLKESMSLDKKSTQPDSLSEVLSSNKPSTPQSMEVDPPKDPAPETTTNSKVFSGASSGFQKPESRDKMEISTESSPKMPPQQPSLVPPTSSSNDNEVQQTTALQKQPHLPTEKVDVPEVEVDSGHDSPGSNLDKSPVVSPHPEAMDSAPPPSSASSSIASGRSPQNEDILDLTMDKSTAIDGQSYSRKRPVPNPPVLNRHRLPAQITRHPSFSLMPPFRHSSPSYLQPFLHHSHHLPKRSKPTMMPVMPMHPYPGMRQMPPHIKVPQIHNRIPKMEQQQQHQQQQLHQNHHVSKLFPRSHDAKSTSRPLPPTKQMMPVSSSHHHSHSHSNSSSTAVTTSSHHSSSSPGSHKGYSRFKGSNLMAYNPDPTSTRPKIVIKNMSPNRSH